MVELLQSRIQVLTDSARCRSMRNWYQRRVTISTTSRAHESSEESKRRASRRHGIRKDDRVLKTAEWYKGGSDKFLTDRRQDRALEDSGV